MIFGYVQCGGLLDINAEPNNSVAAANVPFDVEVLARKGLAGIPVVESCLLSQPQVVLLEQRGDVSGHSALPASGSLREVARNDANSCHVVAWATLYNRLDLLAKLAISNQGDELSDSELILAAYLHWGERCCEHLIGDFVFAVYDQAQQKLFLGRDHLGVRPLYYLQSGDDFYFASSLAIFEDLVHLPLEVDERFLASYAVGVSADWVSTAYKGVNKLPPASQMVVQANAKLSIRPYFELTEPATLELASESDYIEQYQRILKQAVRSRVLDAELIASELSGGLDSSSVTAVAARCMQFPGKHLHTLGIANDQLVAEAMSAVALTSKVAANHFVTKTHNHRMNDTEFVASVGAPVEHENAQGHYPFYHQCQALGISVLLSGFGGDEFVTNEAPVVLVELWQQRKLKKFYQRQRGNSLTRPLHTLRWFYHYLRFGNRSIASRNLTKGAQKTMLHVPLQDSVIEQYGIKDKLLKYASYDSQMRTQNEFALSDRWSPLLTTRLENCSLAAARYGVEYRWPLLDIRLLNFFMSVPAEHKLGPALTGRYLHRRACGEILPHHIAWGPKELVRINRLQRWSQRVLGFGSPLRKNALFLDEDGANPMHKAYRSWLPEIGPPVFSENESPCAAKPAETPQLHAKLAAILDQQKLTNDSATLEARNTAISSGDEQMLYVLQTSRQRLHRLNQWLHARDAAQSN